LNNPIKIILAARKRIANLAVIRILLHAAFPLVAMLAIAIAFNLLNGLAFDYFGYFMDGASVRLFQISLFSMAVVGLLTTAGFGWRAWLSASDFISAADQIDRCVNGRQEVVTLASLCEPARSEAPHRRSQLFPMLWEHVSASLGRLDPSSSFELEVRKPLIRSSILAVVVIMASGAVAFGLMIPAGPTRIVSRRLQLLANTIGGSAPGLAQQQLAAAVDDVANDLVNPKLPPQQKIAELRSIEQELHRFQVQNSGSQAGRGNSSGVGDGRGEGQGASRSGNGLGDSRSGTGVGKAGKGTQQLIELRDDIAKAQAKLQQEADSGNQAATARNDSSKDVEPTHKPGNNPNRQGGQNSANGTGQVPQTQNVASAKMPLGKSALPRATDQGSMGDTHLGEFPKGGNYQRFYKSGERGATISVRDARYVTFQLPSEIESAGNGVVVADNSRPRATAPYTNAPLKPQRLTASPDEQQLVPPRYRELIH
jgi:hypothetical protein